ncbi:MAG: magnesium chelatase, partial [Lachnospiraceae bacterium]|nr:magnesium chelatase [Lachnospiraceae bacterium]
MFGHADTSALIGIDGRPVIVEADYGEGLPSFEMVGFLGAEVKEARERVKVALKNTGILVPPGRLTVNLSPADVRKQGNSFDLPVAVAILIALGVLPQENAAPYSFIGELSLDGALRPVNGTLSHVIAARDSGKRGCVVPEGNAREGAVISGMEIFGFRTL